MPDICETERRIKIEVRKERNWRALQLSVCAHAREREKERFSFCSLVPFFINFLFKCFGKILGRDKILIVIVIALD